MASKFLLKTFVTIPAAAVITDIIIHFMFRIRCTSTHKLLCCTFFSASFCVTFLFAGIVTCIRMHVFSFLFLIIISGLFAVTCLCVIIIIIIIIIIHLLQIRPPWAYCTIRTVDMHSCP
jgi:hypothetical protein